MSGDSVLTEKGIPVDQDNRDEVRILTRSEDLFQSAVRLGTGFPFRFVQSEGVPFEPNCSSSLPAIILLDLGTVPVPVLDSLTLGGIVVIGKGSSLLESWEKYLLKRISASVPSLDLEEFLRDKVRSTLTRCEWPGGAYDFFQGIVETVLISEALRMTDGNRQKTARLLGISRTTLRNRMQERVFADGNLANPDK
ncbi:MAG: helix-turn-helix domain-containing protein [Leptospirales bacterium]